MKYLNAFNKIEGIGPQKLKLIINFFGNWETAWHSNLNDFLECGLGEKMAQKISDQIKTIDPDREWELLEKNGIKIIPQDSPDFPQLLLEINNPPFLLYQKGELDLNSEKFIAIVGSRKYTSYGQAAAEKFASELAQAGITIVSGMALGIDAIAHRSALKAQGKTLAVLGNGLDDKSIYPRYNFNLSQDIVKSGALISEYAPEFTANGLTFPARNRIIAGISLGTLIIEAGEKSGSLITATQALESNREVLALPGSIFSPQSIGTNKLIKQGAKIITKVEDILEEFDFPLTDKKIIRKERIPENETEKKLLAILSHEPLHIDKLAQITKLETMIVSGALTLMEIKGWTKNVGGQNYIII